MTLTITPSVYSPSRCELRLYLKQKGVEPAQASEFLQVIFRLGQRHEKNHLSTFTEVSDLSGKPVAKTLEDIQKGSPAVYQGKLQAQVSVDGQVIEVVGERKSLMDEILKYNEEDLKATWAVFGWLGKV